MILGQWENERKREMKQLIFAVLCVLGAQGAQGAVVDRYGNAVHDGNGKVVHPGGLTVDFISAPGTSGEASGEAPAR
jgi:hypothetical protein